MATRFEGGSAEPCSVTSVTGRFRDGGGVGAGAGAAGGPVAWVDAGAAGASSATGVLRDQRAPILLLAKGLGKFERVERRTNVHFFCIRRR